MWSRQARREVADEESRARKPQTAGPTDLEPNWARVAQARTPDSPLGRTHPISFDIGASLTQPLRDRRILLKSTEVGSCGNSEWNFFL